MGLPKLSTLLPKKSSKKNTNTPPAVSNKTTLPEEVMPWMILT
jgi:hypothetical protein